MAIIRKTSNNKSGCGETGTLIIADGMEIGATIVDNSLPVLEKLNGSLPCNSAIPLVHVYLRELKAHGHTKTYTHMFRANLEPTQIATNC